MYSFTCCDDEEPPMSPIRFRHLGFWFSHSFFVESHGGFNLVVARTVHDVPGREAENGSQVNENGITYYGDLWGLPRCRKSVVPSEKIFHIQMVGFPHLGKHLQEGSMVVVFPWEWCMWMQRIRELSLYPTISLADYSKPAGMDETRKKVPSFSNWHDLKWE